MEPATAPPTRHPTAIGMLCGAGLWQMALLGAGLTLVILVLGKPLERFIHRKFPKLSDHDDVPPKP